MEIDHIFVFSNTLGKEADKLVSFGLTEGSSRFHPGQGTMNRKFYFENFFLEILWVINKKEIQSELTSQTKLWERSQFKKNGYSPFGLCLVNSKSTDKLFEISKVYQPNYFPKGMSIDIITNEHYSKLPWTFRLPYRDKKKTNSKPIEHSNGIRLLTRTEFEMPMDNSCSEFKTFFQSVNDIDFKNRNRTHLTLEFDNKIQGKSKEFSELNLTIKY
ncbi:VOC family protein [uncultured Aquimarina sp.]|uniref:VOC family protein n=1 Tax=uncultured Aquimarina sp. TaxID=575652 RepID=UPI00262E6708|nr:VOC family protein [uncultured Aquimarina sp.]